ncbi:hypothetical protein D3C75_1103300 [compost metagenome]
MHGRGDVVFAPFKYFFQLFPVIHVLKFHLLYRCTGDNQSVQAAVTDFVKRFIEALQMLRRSIFGGMRARMQKDHIHLERGIPD